MHFDSPATIFARNNGDILSQKYVTIAVDVSDVNSLDKAIARLSKVSNVFGGHESIFSQDFTYDVISSFNLTTHNILYQYLVV